MCQLAGFHPQAAMVLEEIIQVDEADKYEAASLCTATFSVGGGKNYFLPLSSHLHSKLVSVCSCSFQWNALSLTRPGFTQSHFSG